MYNRLFTKILDSSIWLEPLATRVVWITFLAAMDQDGFCSFACPANVARRAGVTQEECDLALTCLMSPDANSSDPDNNGKRLERVPGGYLVLNAVKYRDMLNREIQREQTRIRVARHRKCNGEVTPCNARTVTQTKFQKPSSEELGLHASKIGLPNEEVARFVNYYESNGWRVGKNPMKSWTHAMQNWKINFDSNRGSIQNSSAQPGQRPPSIMDLKSVLAAKESLVASLKSKYCTEGPMDITWDDEEKRLEFVKLRREIKEITTRISQMV